VQARANIRLRRLPDSASPEEIARDARWAESVQRMGPDYIAPRAIDNEWAHVVILAAPLEEVPGADALSEMNAYLESCPLMAGKLAVVLTPSGDLMGKAALAGFTVMPPPLSGFKAASDVTAFGKQACQIARSMRTVNNQTVGN